LINNTLYNILLSSVPDSNTLLLDNIIPEKLYPEALKNKVLIRTVDKLLEYKLIDNRPDLYIRESERKKRILNFIGNHLIQLDQPHVFIKNFMHLPDIGDDIDLYLHDLDESADYKLIMDLNYNEVKLSFLNRMGGRTQYYIKDYDIDLEIYHGKFGRIGEYISDYGLFKKTSIVNVSNYSLNVPILEDQILVQIIQSLYSSGKIRISDIIYFIDKHINNKIDYDYLYSIANKLHIRNGCRYYINYINNIIIKYCPERSIISDKYYKVYPVRNNKHLFHKIIIVRLNIYRIIKSILKADFIFSLKLLLIPVLYFSNKINTAIKILVNKKNNEVP